MNNQNQAPLKWGAFVERFSGPNCLFVTTGVLLCGIANKAALTTSAETGDLIPDRRKKALGPLHTVHIS
jgi:hypothetical protein